ncbi:hypothetical protein LTR17_015882 [Elasticomyces elasticus]|nr:hypothetical protein LTR17_015882 [Elasticomyces elasticus]
MRLLYQEDDGTFKLTRIYGEDEVPKYAVLSHTWLAEEDEVNYQDIKKGHGQRKAQSYAKISLCGKLAAREGLRYFWQVHIHILWCDMCCINRSNATEVSEAVICMFRWYQRATRCFAILSDVIVGEDEEDLIFPQSWLADFRRSRWFKRGWTLQELLAPESVEFFSAQGLRLGSKASLRALVSDITRIPGEAFLSGSLDNFSIHQRMSWAADRQTTRKEDKAYSLLGLLGIYMPLLYGEGEHSFVRLRQEIDKKHIKTTKLETLLDKLPTCHSAAFNSRENEHEPTCLAGTRVETLQHITQWADSIDDRYIYWLSGIAGTGKSTIARTIAREYDKRGMLGGSFFFAQGGRAADTLITTLAAQMASKLPSARQHICQAILDDKEIAHQALRDQWDKLIVKPLTKLETRTSPTVVIVLDAMDECDNESDTRIILRLLAETKPQRNCRLRIFVTSRPELPIRCGFQQIPAAERQDYVLQDIRPVLVDRDLTLFFEAKLSSIRTECGLATNWPGTGVVARLVEVSGGLFIWASTACQYIREGGGHFATKRIARLLHGDIRSAAGPESQLDRIYTTVLRERFRAEGYDEDEKAELDRTLRDILGSLVVLIAPLSLEALANLLGLEATRVTLMLANLHTIVSIPSQPNRPIRLHHPTFRTFLLDKARCLDFWVDEKAACKALAENCIHLMAKMLKRDICGLRSPGIRAEDIDRQLIQRCIPSELQYACLYWVEHYQHSGTRLGDDDSVHCLFRDHFLHWLEAIGLMGAGSKRATLVRMYQSLLAPTDNARQLPLVKDARRFLTLQSKIEQKEQAPLQIYCAALAFVRPSNKLRGHFWSQMHPWFVNVRNVQADSHVYEDEYDCVNDLAFTPDGSVLVSGSVNPWVRRWSVESGSPLPKWHAQTDKVSSIAISPDGELLASGSDDSTIAVWKIRSSEIRYTLTGHTNWINAVTFSPDGSLLATGSMDETIRLWDASTGQELGVLRGSTSFVNSIAFSPDSAYIVSGTADQAMPLWDIGKKEVCMFYDGHLGSINSVKFSRDGDRIVSGSDDTTVRLWDAITGSEIMTLHGHAKKVWAVAFSHDACTIASASSDKSIRLWNARTGDTLNTLLGHASGINAVVFSQNDTDIASSSFDGEVRLWDAKTGGLRSRMNKFADDAESDIALTAKSAARTEEPADSEVVADDIIKAHASAVTCLMFSPDGQTVASGSSDNVIKLWTDEGMVQRKLDGHVGGILDLIFSPDSRRLASASEDNTAKLWDPTSRTMLHSFDGHLGSVRRVRFSSVGHLLASCSDDRTIRLWDTSTGSSLATLRGHPDAVSDVSFSANDKLMASCSVDGTICIWDLQSFELLGGPIKAHSKPITSVAVSPDSSLVASCSSDGSIKLWTIMGKICGTLQGHKLPVTSIAFSLDTKRLVSCSEDQTMKLWSVETLSVQDTLDVGVSLRNVEFSPCSRHIKSDRGLVDITSLVSSVSAPTIRGAHHVFVTKDWVKRDDENALWLPPEYRAVSAATCNENMVLGHASGAISFIRF